LKLKPFRLNAIVLDKGVIDGIINGVGLAGFCIGEEIKSGAEWKGHLARLNTPG
jgi:hypothetical protein